VIVFTSPKKRYKAMRVSAVFDRGDTLYVGSAKSAYRLRIYNKTAQSGIAPDEGEYIRFEITFRNSLADTAYKAYLEGDMDLYFLGYLGQMVDEVTYNLVKHILFKNMTVEPRLFENEKDEGIERTKIWLENVVIPCIQKLHLRDPDYTAKLIETLDKMIESVI
jgi:DNA relaxase NicK